MLQTMRAYADREILVVPSVLAYWAVMHEWTFKAQPLTIVEGDWYEDVPEEAWTFSVPKGASPSHVATILDVMNEVSGIENNHFHRRPLLEIYHYENDGTIALYETTVDGLFQVYIYCKDMTSSGSFITAQVITELGHGVRLETKDQNAKHHLTTTQVGTRDLWQKVRALLAERYPSIRLQPRSSVHA